MIESLLPDLTKITVIQCYAPTNPSLIEDKFYGALQKNISKVPKYDVLMVMGDLKAKLELTTQAVRE